MHFGLLSESHLVSSYADICLAAAKLEGVIPLDRAGFTGTEQYAAIRHATHDGYIYAGIAIFYSPEPDLIWLDLLYVAPDFRRRGMGQMLIEAVRQQAKSTGFQRYGLGTLPANYPMLSLVNRCGGFKVDADRSSRDGVYFFENFGPRNKQTVRFHPKADRDRARQKVGESRKQQLIEIRRQVRRFKDGADPSSCMQAIADVTQKAGGRG